MSVTKSLGAMETCTDYKGRAFAPPGEDLYSIYTSTEPKGTSIRGTPPSRGTLVTTAPILNAEI